MRGYSKILLPILGIFFLAGCNNSTAPTPIEQYIFLSHFYVSADPVVQEVMPDILNLDLSGYELIFLGGDLTHSTTSQDANIQYVDSIFDLGNSKVIWATGNHDYSNPEKIPEYTGRPLFYSFNKGGITFIVLDTQDSSCHMVGDQLKMIKQITDTISESSHLVILHHKLIWLYEHPEMRKFQKITNGKICDNTWCLNPNNFYPDVYPFLRQVQHRGIKVVCVAGDLGLNAKEFQFKDNEGIQFIASGVKPGDEDNKILVFEHNIKKRSLSWYFQDL
ncbi:MAG: hypothetical protein IIA45_03910 [Bacteroidetes bacterium]|nr:hypothetical protein [Bacteroidota bacterium]